MLKILTSNKSINYFFILIIMLVFWAYRFFYNPIWIEEHGFWENLLYQNIDPKITKFFSPIIAFIIIYLFSIYLIFRNIQTIIFPKAYQIIGVFFVIFSGLWINLQKAIPDLFASIFFYFAIFQLFKTYKKENTTNSFFDIGFLYGISTIINTNYIFFLPLILFSIFFIKKTSFKEIISFFIGLITIITTTILIFFFFSNIDIFFNYNKMSITNLFIENTHKEDFILFLFPIILIILFVVVYNLFIKTGSLFTNKVNFVLTLSIIYEIIFLCLPGNGINSIIILFVPLAFLSANILVVLKKKYKIIFFYSVILLTIFSQILQIKLIFSK